MGKYVLPIFGFVGIAEEADVRFVAGIGDIVLHSFNHSTAGGAGEVETVGETTLTPNTEDLTEIMTDLRLLHVESAEALDAGSVYHERSLVG